MRPAGSTDLENCPVPDDVLKKLLDATLSVVAEVGRQLPENQRAELAVFCYRRAHLRDLGLSMASLCSRQALVQEAGHAGELIHVQASSLSMPATNEPSRHKGTKAPVSLHVV